MYFTNIGIFYVSPPFMISETLMYVVSAITTRLFIGLVKYYMVVLSGVK